MLQTSMDREFSSGDSVFCNILKKEVTVLARLLFPNENNKVIYKISFDGQIGYREFHHLKRLQPNQILKEIL